MVAGGDGTVCSVMNYVKTVPKWSENNPPLAILPLGTGNDLSRTLGWGFTSEEVNPGQIIQNIQKKGKAELLDRWAMTIIHK